MTPHLLQVDMDACRNQVSRRVSARQSIADSVCEFQSIRLTQLFHIRSATGFVLTRMTRRLMFIMWWHSRRLLKTFPNQSIPNINKSIWCEATGVSDQRNTSELRSLSIHQNWLRCNHNQLRSTKPQKIAAQKFAPTNEFLWADPTAPHQIPRTSAQVAHRVRALRDRATNACRGFKAPIPKLCSKTHIST